MKAAVAVRERCSDSGLGVIAARIAQVPALVSEVLRKPQINLPESLRSARNYVVTGIGSSEAHANYLVYLLRRHGKEACFKGFHEFSGVNALRGVSNDAALIVWSQGFSPNASIPLAFRKKFLGGSVLFSGISGDRKQIGVNPSKLLAVQRLSNGGTRLIKFAPADEYQVFVRTLGPIAGYAAAIQFVDALVGRSDYNYRRAARIEALVDQKLPRIDGASACTSLLTDWYQKRGSRSVPVTLVLAAPIPEACLNNIALKLQEFLFVPRPQICSALSAGHGPLQEHFQSKRPIIVLGLADRSSMGLSSLVERSCANGNIPFSRLVVDARPEIAIFGFEHAMNLILLDVAKALGVDQFNWPGRKNGEMSTYKLTSLRFGS